jgi:hypothetical protein
MIEENGGSILFTSKQQTKSEVYVYGNYFVCKLGSDINWNEPEKALSVAPDQLGYWDDTDTDT